LIEEQDVTAYLAGKGVQVYRSAGNEVTAHCLWCLDGDPKGKGRLYINTETWLYKCFRCDAAGNRKTLLEHFGDDDGLRHVPGTDPAMRRRILTEVAEVAHEMLLANEAKAQYLLDRGISEELIVEQMLGYVPKNVGISEMIPVFQAGNVNYRDLIGAGVITLSGKEFFSDSIIIPYWSHGSVVQLRSKDIGGKYKSTNNDTTRLYNSDALLGAVNVLITEGEFDCLRVVRAIRDSNDRSLQTLGVVGLPGAGVWPDGLVHMLDHATKVYIGLDPDETGDKFADKLREEIGGKARIVRLPPELPKTDWTDWFKAKSPSNPHGGHDWRDLRDLLVEADLAGKRMFTVTDAAARWRKQKVESPGLKLGWPGLDSVLRPGLKPGQIMIPLARTGTGKTVWLSNVAFNLRDRHVLFISLEMTAPEVFEHLRRIHRFWFPAAPQSQVNDDLSRLRIVDQNRIGKGDLGDLIREYTEEVGHKPDVVIVDYLQYYARGFRGNSTYEKVNDATMELKAVAKEAFLGIICPSQVNRGTEGGKPLTIDDARDSGVIEETGDYVLGLFRPDQLQSRDDNAPQLPQNGGFKVQLLKGRHGGVGRVFDLRLSLMSLAIVDVLFDRKAATRVDQENALARQGLHYDDYRAQAENAVAQGELRLVNE
jgi:hypothetical protein